jgi:hypothetical protein
LANFIFQLPSEPMVHEILTNPRRHNVEEAIVACLAGLAAESLAIGRICWESGSRDVDLACDLATKLDRLHADDLEPYLKYLWARANRLLKRPGYWLAVERLATRLLEVDGLSRCEADKILQSSLKHAERRGHSGANTAPVNAVALFR